MYIYKIYTHIHIKPWQKCWQLNTDPSNYGVFLNFSVVKFSCLGIIVLVYKRKGVQRERERQRKGEMERQREMRREKAHVWGRENTF